MYQIIEEMLLSKYETTSNMYLKDHLEKNEIVECDSLVDMLIKAKNLVIKF